MWNLLLIFVISTPFCLAQIINKVEEDVSFQIVGIFDSNAKSQIMAFNESVLNAKSGSLNLKPMIIYPEARDSYSVWQALCRNSDIRPVVVIGPQNPITDSTIRNQCTKAQIPHIQATLQPFDPDLEFIDEADNAIDTKEEANEEKEEETEGETTNTDNVKPVYQDITINFYPESNEIAIAYAQLLKYFNWNNFAILYEDYYGLLRVQKILAEHTQRFTITVYKLNPDRENYDVFKQLQKAQETRFLIDCHVDRIMKYMKEAQELQIVNPYQHYILVNLDASIYKEELQTFSSNITWLSLTDVEKLSNAGYDLAQRVGSWKNKLTQIPDPIYKFQTEALIMEDIANHVLMALEIVNENKPSNSPCNEGEVWEYGALLQNALLKNTTTGVTGHIEFNEKGKRINYVLYVNTIYLMKLDIIGTWESKNGDRIIEDLPKQGAIANQMNNKNFIIMSRKAKPYFYDKTPCAEEDENCVDDGAKYEGFSVDLVDRIFNILREEMNLSYTYKFEYAEDSSYGKIDPKTKKWTGLIGNLLSQKADLVVCDLTITEQRKKVVDFSVPFMSLGISILYTQESKIPPSTFSFLNPYSLEVWMYTATAYCVVSIILFVCSRLSPADWENPQPCEKDPEELENIWNFKNCTWLTMGSIMTQGCDILPKAIGSRWVCGIWWFFAMIVCQTYIAQLAASLTEANENEPINSIDDLAKQTKIRYGAVDGGSTLEFFKNSKDKMYQRMYENMMANPAVLVDSNDEGEKRVLNSKNKYAFFMESCTIEYKLKRNCDLKKIGDQLDSKDYGIAMPPSSTRRADIIAIHRNKDYGLVIDPTVRFETNDENQAENIDKLKRNSPFRSNINTAILRLKELTVLDEIRKKWWDNMYGAKECAKPIDKSDVEGDLEMENLIGAFLVLIVGLVFCFFVTAAEFLNEIQNIVVREHVPFKEAFMKELKSSLNFFQLQKPVLKNPSRAGSRESSVEDNDLRQLKKAAAITDFLDLEKMVQ